jgi:hypothetical protein
MHVMPAICVEKSALSRTLQFHPDVRGDTARNFIVNGMTKLQTVKTQVFKQPGTQRGYCTRRQTSTASFGGDPISNFGFSIPKINSAQPDSSDR